MSDSPPLPPGGDAFLAACRKAPEDAELRLVFADWLLDRDDRRGEFLRALIVAWGTAAALPAPIPENPEASACLNRARARLMAAGREKRAGEKVWRLWRVWGCCCLRECPLPGGRVWNLLDAPARAAVVAAELYACDLLSREPMRAASRAARTHVGPADEVPAESVVGLQTARSDAGAVASPHTPTVAAWFGNRWRDFRWCAALADRLPVVVPEFARE
jgi:uncharacterized protein (TIGR02996 family)